MLIDAGKVRSGAILGWRRDLATMYRQCPAHLRRLVLLALSAACILLYANSGSMHVPSSGRAPGGGGLTSIWRTQPLAAPARSSSARYNASIVIAATVHDDLTWTHTLADLFPPTTDVQVLRYMADDDTAPLHPKENKGRESSVYFSFIIDNYDDLPDFVFFAHGHAETWHNERVFTFSTARAMGSLDLAEVTRRGMVKLRVEPTQGGGWVVGQVDPLRPEDEFLEGAWRELFEAEAARGELEELTVLNSPCCAQFVVSRAAIRSRSRAEYEHYRDWTYASPHDDGITGRLWENFWQIVFRHTNVDTPVRHKALCAGWALCWPSAAAYQTWVDWSVEQEGARATLRRLADEDAVDGPDMPDGQPKGEPLDPAQRREVQQRIYDLAELVTADLERARVRGRDVGFRDWCRRTLFDEDEGTSDGRTSEGR